MSAATAAEIQKINEQMTLLQAQLNQLELKAKIASKQKEISGATGETPLHSSFASRNGNPSVLSVSGLKGRLEAVLVFPGGVTQRVRAGDVIDDRRVAKVALTEVVLTDLKGKSIQRLAFGASPVTRENTPLAGNGVLPSPVMPLPAGMPAMPPR
jgi:type IV pilus biogenesis protein PilP